MQSLVLMQYEISGSANRFVAVIFLGTDEGGPYGR